MNTYEICDKHGHIGTIAATELQVEEKEDGPVLTFFSGDEVVGHFRDYAWWVKRAEGGATTKITVEDFVFGVQQCKDRNGR